MLVAIMKWSSLPRRVPKLLYDIEEISPIKLLGVNLSTDV